MDQGDSGSTAITGPAGTTPRSTSPKLRPYKCPHCKVSFKRVDHLKRHIQLRISSLAWFYRPTWLCALAHMRQILWKCNTNVPAVTYFLESISTHAKDTCREFGLHLITSSDVLARHLQRCDKAQNNPDLLPKSSVKQTRAKSACNRCAKSKLKCDSQEPCGHCKCRSLTCKYTRQGYSDPYSVFRIGPRSGPSRSLDNDLDRPSGEYPRSESNESSGRTPPAMQPEHFAIPPNPFDDNLQHLGVQQLHNKGIDIAHSTKDLSMSSDNALSDQNPAKSHNTVYMPTDLDLTSMFDFPFESESLLFHPETMGYVDFDYSTVTQPPCPGDDSMIHSVSLSQPLQEQG